MRKVITSFVLFLVIFSSKGQNVGIGTNTPHPSAALDISSSTSGFLPPRMTNAERNGINNPTAGLMIYNTSTDCLEIFGKGKWNPVYCVPADTTAGNDSTMVTDIDGNTYPTVKICDQTWMAKNLDVARYRNGDPIPQVTDPTQWANLTTGAWCWYNNDSATYGSVYGRLYNWYAVNDPRGLAPQGWHVPSDGEWNKLVKCLDANADIVCIDCIANTIAGNALKEVGTEHWISPNLNATNTSEFSGLPGGNRDWSGAFLYVDNNKIGSYGFWWTSTSASSDKAINFELHHNNSSVPRYRNFKTYAYSIRCVKDTPITTLNNGLVAYYPFSGNAGDSSGNGNHGTVNGTTLTTDRFGNTNKAYSFNNNYIIVPNSNSFDYTDFTVSFWMKTSDASTQVPITQLKYNDASEEKFSFALNYNGLNKTHFACKYNIAPSCTPGVGWILNEHTINVSDNTFHHIIGTVEGNTMKFYIDGNLLGSVLGNSNQSSNCYGGDIQIGRSWNNFPYYFNGTIDDIRIYNRALTQAEITYLATH